MYVDNLTSGSNTVEKVEILKEKCEDSFKKVVSLYASDILTYCH